MYKKQDEGHIFAAIYGSALQRLVRQNIRSNPVKRVEKFKVKVKLHVIKGIIWLPAHILAARIENMVQHTPHDGTGGHAHGAIRSRWIDPLEEAY
ncbi:hypothetical protein TASIC1_0006014800 [Trichoderma asperellum]|uniref:Uncharacterized protein n=1 Tax=Trichoderma asperellum TaxID=101201 RepID=A0A6V8QYQ3_TRIAP|nr:hypothetical protein TASIC1_0006014800 [Trichoderma asperellum]